MAYDEKLAERAHALLGKLPLQPGEAVSEKKMFGGLGLLLFLASAASCRPDGGAAGSLASSDSPSSSAASVTSGTTASLPGTATQAAATDAPGPPGTTAAPTGDLDAGSPPSPTSHPASAARLAKCTVTGKATPVTAPALDRAAKGVSEKNLKAWISTLADCKKLKGRDAGSAESRGAAELLAKELASAGVAAAAPDGEYCQAFDAGGKPDQNVVGRLSRNGGAKGPVVIVGAHYDHLGSPGGVCYPGADDNASGVAALLEVARVLGQGGSDRPAGSDVVFVFFGAEERGLLGSKHFAAHPLVPWGDVKLMVNVDMVGRKLLENGLPPSESGVSFGPETIAYVFVDSATTAAVNGAGASAGVSLQGVKKSLLTTLAGDYASDDDSFVGRTSTVFLSTSIHLDYHRPTDTAAKIDVAQVARAAKVVLELAR